MLCYPLFAALVIYIQQNPFPGFAGPVNIVFITASYAATAFGAYASLYGRKSNALQTNEDRLRQIEVTVKILIYSCLACVVFLSLNFTLVLLDLQRFEPLALSLFCVICAVLYSMGLNSPPPRQGIIRSCLDLRRRNRRCSERLKNWNSRKETRPNKRLERSGNILLLG